MSATASESMPRDAPRPTKAFSALANKQFTFFWLAAIVSNSATWMQQVAVAAVIYDLSGRQGKWLGIVSLASAVPNIILTPFAGVLADRVSRRVILSITQFVLAACALVLWVLYVRDLLTPWRIVAVTFASGVASGFTVASWQSFVPTLVPREHLVEAVRLNSLQFTLSRALGPSIGALLLKLWGEGSAFMSNAVTYFLVIGAILFARPTQIIAKKANESFRAVFVEGARYVARDPTLRLIVMFTTVISATGQSLMTVAAAASFRLFGHSAQDNSWLVAAVGAGSAVSAMIVLATANRARRTVLVRIGIGIYVVGLVLIPSTNRFGVGVLGYALTGAAHMLVATSLNTWIQASVPDHIRGRVMSFYLLGIMIGFPLGAYAIGVAGDVFGLRRVLVADALIFAVVTLTTVRARRFRRVDDDGAARVETVRVAV